MTTTSKISLASISQTSMRYWPGRMPRSTAQHGPSALATVRLKKIHCFYDLDRDEDARLGVREGAAGGTRSGSG